MHPHFNAYKPFIKAILSVKRKTHLFWSEDQHIDLIWMTFTDIKQRLVSQLAYLHLISDA